MHEMTTCDSIVSYKCLLNELMLTYAYMQNYAVSVRVAVFVNLLILCGDVELNPGPCTMINESQVALLKGLTLAHLNVRSLLPKLDDLKMVIQNSKLNFLMISESWLSDKITDAEVEIPHFLIHRQDRDPLGRARGRGGGAK